ncbi:MAG: Type 11 methyltransferase [Candidatus Magasanikbacteria bacterium GW2011_GWC2_37_14]|uniref:Type 11 methyltransferase n=1 Tax=Candidatus Magasanikbacteria bacterium GW2011_GWC2_37_14 TaxID=1619046 RepID=A0A0G0JIK5_9BACT|nr:MAG: Type 11 methyltransferase [Candidatus Magasanikbacteria bacterium GW2011_GWC2_37_14]
MSPKVFKCFEKIIQNYYEQKSKPLSVIELGAYYWSLLKIDTFANSRKVAFNLSFTDGDKLALKDYEIVEGNINNLPFKDNELDCILSCSVFEHDKYFWKSFAEINRVIKIGGLLVIGVPVYVSLKTDCLNTTLTYHRHGKNYNADFYRFSEQAVREVFFEGYKIVATQLVRRYPNPYLIMAGIKL